MTRLGCLTPLGIIAGAFALLVTLGLSIVSGGTMFSPGALNAANQGGGVLGGVKSHAETGGNCAACHADLWDAQTMSDHCLSCHTNVQAELKDSKSLHGGTAQNMECRACHSEHNGATAALTRVGTDFPHDQVGFSLAKHQAQSNGVAYACADCHGDDFVQFDKTTCVKCHEKEEAKFTVHVTDYGTECLGCHDGADRYSNFNHQAVAFKLDGKHATANCSTCHMNARVVADFKNTAQTCNECHTQDDAHKGTYGTDCASCHSANNWQDSTFDHNRVAFPLTGAHAQVECAKCHTNNAFESTPQNCVDCHRQDDKHNGAYGTDCAACHTAEDWKNATFDHNLSVFPLTGAHVRVECAACHANNVFKGTPQKCIDCHSKDDKHKNAYGTACESCHTTESWKGATFEHSFPINHGVRRGGANTECAVCHPSATDLKTYTCYGCHEHTPANIAREHENEQNIDDCIRCHANGEKHGEGSENGGGREGGGGDDD